MALYKHLTWSIERIWFGRSCYTRRIKVTDRDALVPFSRPQGTKASLKGVGDSSLVNQRHFWLYCSVLFQDSDGGPRSDAPASAPPAFSALRHSRIVSSTSEEEEALTEKFLKINCKYITDGKASQVQQLFSNTDAVLSGDFVLSRLYNIEPVYSLARQSVWLVFSQVLLSEKTLHQNFIVLTVAL